MSALIRVELKDGTYCRVAPRGLDLFLALGQVIRFRRSDGWVVVGRDRIRMKRRVKSCPACCTLQRKTAAPASGVLDAEQA